MRTSESVVSITDDRTKLSAARRRIVAAGLALAILAILAGAAGGPLITYAGTSSTPPVSKCTDFGCQE
jgi:hypothetical protein